AEHATEHRGRRTDRGIEPGASRARQRHRNQHYVRRHGEERAFSKRYRRHDPQCVWLVGRVDTPIVNPPEHAAIKHPATDLSMPENDEFASMALAQAAA